MSWDWDWEYPSLEDEPWWNAPLPEGGAWTARLFCVTPQGTAFQVGSPFAYGPSRAAIERVVHWMNLQTNKQLETKE